MTREPDAFSVVAEGGLLFDDEEPSPIVAHGAIAMIAGLEAEIKRLRWLIDRDRTGLAHALNAVIRRASGSWWLGEDGLEGFAGSREKYHAEVARLIEEIVEIAKSALLRSGARADEAFRPNCRPVRDVCANVPQDCVTPPDPQGNLFQQPNLFDDV